jgi:iron complex outermembrane receptor protein
MKNLSLPFIVSAAIFSVSSSMAQVTEVEVIGISTTSELTTSDRMLSAADAGQLLKRLPGTNINKNGELTSIAQYRGMFGNRVNVAINGMPISSGGPNAMDSPLHYAPVAMLEAITLHRGITPVSLGLETIGGSMEANTFRGDFAGRGFQFNSKIYLGGQTLNNGDVANAFFTLANEQHLFRANLLKESADDSEFSDGDILPSSYERDRFDIGYGYKNGNHVFNVDYAVNNTGDAGTPALPMDILAIDSKLSRVEYRWQGNSRNILLQFSNNDIEHDMTNYHLRRPPQGNAMVMAPMLYRSTHATSDNQSFLIKVEQNANHGIWRYGIDGHFSSHDADISNPNAAPFYVENFDGVEKEIIGLFLEKEHEIGEQSLLEAGIRVNQYELSSDMVGANLNPMGLTAGMPFMMNSMANMLAAGFNAADRSNDDTNYDLFAKYSYHQSASTTLYAGLARKSRSPSYQELFLWMPLEATGGLADGKTYVGNLNLESEISHEIELGLDWNSQNLSLSPRIFYKDIDDYIQGTPSQNAMVNNFTSMMSNMGMGRPDPLQFNNVDAEIYGFDMEAGYALTANWYLRSVASITQGKRKDIDDNLYRIAPANLLLALDYLAESWMFTLESISYARQSKVSVTNLETQTSGYTLLNASAQVQLPGNIDLGVGVDNIFDRYYQDHLGGYNRAFNPNIALRDRLPGLGRNIYARLIWEY